MARELRPSIDPPTTTAEVRGHRGEADHRTEPVIGIEHERWAGDTAPGRARARAPQLGSGELAEGIDKDRGQSRFGCGGKRTRAAALPDEVHATAEKVDRGVSAVKQEPPGRLM